MAFWIRLCLLSLSNVAATSEGMQRPRSKELFQELDAAQRRVAEQWEEDCRADNATTCMAEDALDFQLRYLDKVKALRSHVVKEKVALGALPYAADTDQLEKVPKGFSAEVPEMYFGPDAPVGWRLFQAAQLWVSGKTLAREAGRHLRESGVVLLRGAVEKRACEAALSFLMRSGAHPRPEITEEVQMARYRHHFRLRLEEAMVAPAVRGILEAVGETLTTLMTSEAHLVELAAFLTNPGAKGQGFHSDVQPSDADKVAPLYTAMLFLTPVAADGGRLEVVPSTHLLSPLRALLWELFNGSKENMTAEEQAAHKAELRSVGIATSHLDRGVPAMIGDIVIYDSSLVHRGAANRSDRTRGVLYMTFMGQGEDPGGATLAIHTELLRPPRGPLSLKALSQQFIKPTASFGAEL